MPNEGLRGPPGPPATLGPREVFGVPVLPPAPAAAVVNRLRAGLARRRRAPAPPPVRILEGLLGALDLAALVAMCRVGLPEELTEPMETGRLAVVLETDPDRLQRLLRYAATRGWVRLDRRGRVHPTPTLTFLRHDHPAGWRAWVEFMSGPEIAAALGRLDAGLTEGGDAFAAANGASYFAWMGVHPRRHAAFDEAMAAGGRMHGLLLARALDWSASRRVCDVGGGTGALLSTVLGAHPHLEGVLFDLPDVVMRAPAVARMATSGGDAFASVPPGCDTYLLVNVLHDWGDDDAVRLLRRVAAAMTGGDAAPSRAATPRAVVLEGLANTRPRDDLVARSDLLMFALTPGGRERTREEFAELAATAGLRLQRLIKLASGETAQVLIAEGAR
jgi:hypothetical protein